MKLEKVWLYLSLFLLLVAGFSLINILVYLELRRIEEENLYRMAYQHFLVYLHNPHHRGDQNFVLNPPEGESYRVYVFEDPFSPAKQVKVGVREEFTKKNIDELMKRLFLAEFLLVLALVFLYQSIVEGYFAKLREKEEWIRGLMLSLMHRLGNFLATQKILLTMLKKSYPADPNLKRLELSLARAQRELSLFINPVRDDGENRKEYLDLEEQIREVLSYFEEELKSRRLILSIRTFYVHMNREDLQDVLYNLISNAVRHSGSYLHIKLCAKKGILAIRNDVGYARKKEGMGIGVELTRRILSRYGFELRINLRKTYTAFVFFRKRD